MNSEKLNKNLHNTTNHPIETIKKIIHNYFGNDFKKFDDLKPQVSIEDNFDKLLIPKDHVSRGPSDTYYVDHQTVLRTHTSAHQNELLCQGHRQFLVTGDVFRKDTIDASHSPVFHQMEGVKICEDGIDVEQDLRNHIEGLIESLFPKCEYIMREDKFPFTSPSWEVDVLYNGEWLEVLGCGIIHEQIMTNCGLKDKKGWAFGLGLERLAMILFKIPDIRYFWTDDQRFHKQFNGNIIEFKEYSKYPPCKKDISFWISDEFTENDFCEIVRNKGGDLIEDVTLIDEFTNSKTLKKSLCYRITYRSNDRVLTNEEINKIQDDVIKNVSINLNVQIR